MYCTDFFKNISKKFKKKCRFYEFRLSTNLKNKNNLRLGWTEILSGKKSSYKWAWINSKSILIKIF